MATSNSFVERINTVANAVDAVAGDILTDANAAKDAAEASAIAADESAVDALASENLASDWADKGHNNPVTGTVGIDAKFSSYHWATEAEIAVGDPLINDALISISYVWSSDFINSKLALKSDITHTHAGTYEPVFSKKTAFNQDYGTDVGTVAQGHHVHDGSNGSVEYETAIGAKGTAFNKNFGTASGEVSEGNHTHPYEPEFSKNTGFNKPFVVDTVNPTADEVPRGNHTHPASVISYDNSGNVVVSSTTVQGAVQNLDAVLGTIEIIEKTYGTIALDGTTRTVTITTQGVPTKMDALTKVAGTFQNLVSSSACNLTMNYPIDPDNLIEGRFSANVTIEYPAAGAEISLTAYVNGVPVSADWSADVKTTTLDGSTTGTLALDGYITGMSNGDYIEMYVTNNTGTEDIVVRSLTMVFDGAPQGALVATGLTVAHNDVTGRDVADQHPISSISSLQTELDGKSATSHTHLVADVTDFDPTTKTDKIIPAATGNVATLDGTGNLTDSGILLSSKAEVAGSSTQLFSAQDGTTGNEVVNRGQLDVVNTNADSKIPKVSTPTEGNFPQVAADGTLTDSIYDETSFADATHSHSISEVTDLQTTLDSKYAKVTTPTTGNIPSFGAGDVLADSGVAPSDLVSTSGDTMTGELIVPSLVIDDQNASAHSFRNHLINGDFRVWNRGLSFDIGVAFTSIADKWEIVSTVAGGIVAFGNKFFPLKIVDLSTGSTTIRQPIDSGYLQDKTVTVSFDIWANDTGIDVSSVSMRQHGGTDNNVETVPDGTEVTSGSWQHKSYTMTLVEETFKDDIDWIDFDVVLLGNGVTDCWLKNFQIEEGNIDSVFEKRPLELEKMLCGQPDDDSYLLNTPMLDYSGRKNRIINGDFRVNKRTTFGSAFPIIDTTQKIIDRWVTGGNTSGELVASIQATGSLRYTVSIANIDLSGINWFAGFWQKIEAQSIFDLNGKYATLSFWFKSSTIGTHSVAFRGTDSDDCYVTSFSYAVADIFQKIEITLKINDLIVAARDEGTGIDFLISAQNNGDYVAATTDEWVNVGITDFVYPGSVDWITTVGNYIEIKEVQFEEGAIATNFEKKSYAEELALCQRYYETGTCYSIGYESSDSIVYTQWVPFVVTKRASGVMSFSGYGAEGYTVGELINNVMNIGGFRARDITASGSTAGQAYAINYTFYADAEL